MRPATVADRTEIETREIAVADRFLNILFATIRLAIRSKEKLAAVNPRKNTPPGFNRKFMIVATTPTTVTAPNFRTHQKVRPRAAKPIMSQRMGNPNIRKTIGEKMLFSTPQRLEKRATAANSRLSK
jgi:hypothetical protein